MVSTIRRLDWRLDSQLQQQRAEMVNLVHFTDFPRGGHFMAWEEPELYAADLQGFKRALQG
jgi:pimeloyl-ACP methyl ester carboxylesterase